MTRRVILISICAMMIVNGVMWMQAAGPMTDVIQAASPTAVLGAISTQTPTPLPPTPEDPRPALCSAPYQTGWEAHVVKAGDTLGALMQGIHELSVTQAAALNCIDDPSRLPVGSVVWLPKVSTKDEATVEPCQPLAKGVDCGQSSQGILGAQQIFQNGMMLWREDTRQIWVIVHLEDGDQLSVFDDTYVEGEPDPTDTPPNTFFVPKRGFGKVWVQLGGAKSPLGWATAPESQISLTIQPAGRVSYTTYIQMPDGTVYAATVLPHQNAGWWVKVGTGS